MNAANMKAAAARSDLLSALLAERIRSHGPVTFAEFMEACLYHPQHGYYSRLNGQPLRDYFTSVDVRPLFARLLARQLHQMWTLLLRPAPFFLVELGAGTGDLAAQILEFSRCEWPQFYDAVRYIAVERSTDRRAAQSEKLADHISSGHFSARADLPNEISCGCIFSNEFFDALPVHRVLRDEHTLREIYVGLEDDAFCDRLGPISNPDLADYLDTQQVELAPGQQAEVCLDACRYIEDAGKRLTHGFVLTIDYGHEAPELYDSRHMRGTLLAYHRHRASEDFLRSPGHHDLTSHVNFTALDRWGARAGLARTGFTSQTNFLMALARASNFADLDAPELTEQQRAHLRLMFKTLIYPEGMGETFHVLVQHKGIASPKLEGLEPL
jgi:SAM-dependent MidA family methyltransferase